MARQIVDIQEEEGNLSSAKSNIHKGIDEHNLTASIGNLSLSNIDNANITSMSWVSHAPSGHVSIDYQGFKDVLNQLDDVDKLRASYYIQEATIAQHNLNSELERTKQEYLQEHPDGQGLTEAIQQTIDKNPNGIFSLQNPLLNSLGQLANAYGKSVYNQVASYTQQTNEKMQASWRDQAYLAEMAQFTAYQETEAQRIATDNIFLIEGSPEKYEQCLEEIHNTYNALCLSVGKTSAESFLKNTMHKFQLAYGKGLIRQNASSFLALAEKGEYNEQISPELLGGLKIFAKEHVKKQQHEARLLASEQFHIKLAQSKNEYYRLEYEHLQDPSSVTEFDVENNPALTTADKISLIKTLRKANIQHREASILDKEIGQKIYQGQGISEYSADVQTEYLTQYLPVETDPKTHEVKAPTYKSMVNTATAIGVSKPNTLLTNRLVHAMLHSNLETEAGIENFYDAKEALLDAFNLNSPFLNTELTSKDEFKMVEYMAEKFDSDYNDRVTTSDIKMERQRLLDSWAQYTEAKKNKFNTTPDDTDNLQIVKRKNDEPEYNNAEYNQAFNKVINDLKDEGIDISADTAIKWRNDLREKIKENYTYWVQKFGVSKAEALGLTVNSFKRGLRETCLFDDDDKVMRNAIESQLPGLDDTQYQLRWYAIATLCNDDLMRTHHTRIHGYTYKGLKEEPKIKKAFDFVFMLPMNNEEIDPSYHEVVKQKIPYSLAYKEPIFLLEKDGTTYEGKLRFEYDKQIKTNRLYLKVKNKELGVTEELALYRANGRPYTFRFDNPVIQKRVERRYYNSQIEKVTAQQAIQTQKENEAKKRETFVKKSLDAK